MVLPSSSRPPSAARCTRSRAARATRCEGVNDRVVIDRDAFDGPAELRERGLHLWSGRHGGQGARGARVAGQAATLGRAAAAPARGRRLCFAAQRRRRHRHGRARRRPGAGPARPDGRGDRDRDAEVWGLHAPQVPDLLHLRDGARRRPADLRQSGRGQGADRLPVDAAVGDPLLAWAVLDCPSVYAIESVDQRLYAADRLPAGCGQAIAPARTGGPGISRRADQPAQTPSQLAQTGVGEPSTNLAGNDIPR